MSNHPDDPEQPADAGQDPDENEFLKEFQELLEGYAEAQMAGKDEAALTQALQAFQLATDWAEEHPTPDLRLMEQADACERSGDWPGAERARREVLKLKETEGNPGLIAKAHHDLSRLLQLRGRLDEAWESALAASAAARLCQINIVIAMMLENEAWCALLRGEPDRALQATRTGLGSLEPSRLNEGIRGRLWVAQARCFAAKQCWQETELAVTQAQSLIAERALGTCCPGPLSGEAACWEIKAMLCAARSDDPGAVEAWQHAVDKRRQVIAFAHLKSPYTLMALGRALEGLAQALQEQGLDEQASPYREEAAEARRHAHEGRAPPDTPESMK